MHIRKLKKKNTHYLEEKPLKDKLLGQTPLKMVSTLQESLSNLDKSSSVILTQFNGKIPDTLRPGT